MGSPRNEIYRFNIKWQTELLSTAKQTAMHFRVIGQYAQALELLRQSLLPFVDWLDKPIKECFLGYGDSPFHRGPKRAMPVFRWYGEALSLVTLDRRGRWIMMERVQTSEPNLYALKEMSSGTLAAKIEEHRINILDSIPFLTERKHLGTAEDLGLHSVIVHCAFVRYVQQGLKAVGKMLVEREERLRVMRTNHDTLMSFAAGLDPLAFDPKQVPTFSVWNDHGRGKSRCSGTYFVREPVEAQVREQNTKQGSDPDVKYFVYEDSRSLRELDWFLRGVCTSIENIKETFSSDARQPMSDEERAAIKNVADSIGSVC